MGNKSLSEALGIDRTAEEALGRAGVRTIAELGEADPESLAMASGIPKERIEEWQEQVRRAQSKPRAGNPVLTGTLIAMLGLLLAGALGWIMMTIASNKMKDAERIMQPLNLALGFFAEESINSTQASRLALSNNNWGEAQTHLSRVNELVTFMEQIGVGEKRQQVNEIRAALGDAQLAVGQQTDDARDKVDNLVAQLDKLRSTR